MAETLLGASCPTNSVAPVLVITGMVATDVACDSSFDPVGEILKPFATGPNLAQFATYEKLLSGFLKAQTHPLSIGEDNSRRAAVYELESGLLEDRDDSQKLVRLGHGREPSPRSFHAPDRRYAHLRFAREFLLGPPQVRARHAYLSVDDAHSANASMF